MAYYVYILHCADDTFYTGMTSNLEARLAKHLHGADKRAYTYSRRPLKLVWSEEHPTKEAARAREKQIKILSRARKEKLVRSREPALD